MYLSNDAKGYAKATSDIDLCISCFFNRIIIVGLIEELHAVSIKKVEVLRLNDLNDNINLINEIMKDGIRIYSFEMTS